MKCNRCGHQSPKGSSFCENCGLQLIHKIEESGAGQAISDVVFVPQKRGSSIFKIIGLTIVLFIVGIIVLGMIYSEDNTFNTNTDNNVLIFPIEKLEITKSKLDWAGQTLFFEGVLKNDHFLPVKDVSVRLNLCEDQGCADIFDTRFITIAGAAPNGAYTFSEPVYVEVREKRFWWNYRIESAETNY